jgi:threonine/homoserine/homoserine lactone efflux protein
MLIYITRGIALGLAAAAQPGPLQTFLIARSLDQGWRRTLPAALAPLISDGPIIALVLLVLSQIPPWFERFLYLAGGIFVLYLAWNAFKAWRAFDPTATTAPSSTRQSVLRAVMTNFVSPGPYIFWSLVLGPLLVAGWRETPANALGLLLSFYGTFIISLMGIIILFGSARQLGPKVNRGLLGVSAVALMGFGCYQIWIALSGG